MKIIVDGEGAQVVRQLCDIALKATGIQNLGGVVNILNTMEVDLNLGKSSEVEDDEKENDKLNS